MHSMMKTDRWMLTTSCPSESKLVGDGAIITRHRIQNGVTTTIPAMSPHAACLLSGKSWNVSTRNSLQGFWCIPFSTLSLDTLLRMQSLQGQLWNGTKACELVLVIMLRIDPLVSQWCFMLLSLMIHIVSYCDVKTHDVVF